MEPLLSSLQPLVKKRVGQFSGRVPIPTEALNAEANRRVIEGLRRYDPSKAQMHTFLTTQLRGMRRYVLTRQNLARITEGRGERIGDYERAVAYLTEIQGRPPTAQEIADEMQVSHKFVTKLTQELRPDLLASQSPVEDPFVDETPRAKEVLKLIRFELNPNELAVFEYLTGDGGKPKLTSTGQIARQLGWSDSKVSQTKKAIAEKVKRHL